MLPANAIIELYRIDWKRFGYPFCGIYLIVPAPTRRPVKIGLSTNAAERLWDLQVAHWTKLEIGWYRYCSSTDEAKAVEQKSHVLLEKLQRNLSGEWFNVSVEQASEVVMLASKSLGIPLLDKISDEKIHRAAHRARQNSLRKTARRAPDNPDEESAWWKENKRGTELRRAQIIRRWPG